jgi:hypothetical protein
MIMQDRARRRHPRCLFFPRKNFGTSRWQLNIEPYNILQECLRSLTGEDMSARGGGRQRERILSDCLSKRNRAQTTQSLLGP